MEIKHLLIHQAANDLLFLLVGIAAELPVETGCNEILRMF